MAEEIEIFVPGRLCILGEHTDWAGEYRDHNGAIPYGMALVCTTNEGLHAKCTKYKPGYLRFECNNEGDEKILDCNVFGTDLTKIATEGSFFSYVAGTMMALIANPIWANLITEFGIKINNYQTTLPMKKGLSSSAAVCVLVVQCFSDLFHLYLELQQVMELAYLGEMNTPSRCGRMDQCVSMGRDSIGLMEFNGSRCILHRLSTPIPIYFVVADLKASKDTVVILRELNACFPHPRSLEEYGMHRYAHLNQDLAWKAILAISSGDLNSLADAMIQSQNLFNNCAVINCPSELTAPILNKTINDSLLNSLHLAAKGVGSQGDGSIQFLCHSAEQQSQLLAALKNDPWKYDAFALTIAPTSGVSAGPRSRILSALVVCQGIDCCDQLSTPNLTSQLTDFLLELIACGIRNLTLLCCNECDGVCGAIGMPPQPPPQSQWSYSVANLQHLSKYLVFHSISSQDQFEESLRNALKDILLFNQQQQQDISSTSVSTAGVSILLASVQHSQQRDSPSATATATATGSSQVVYQMLSSTSTSTEKKEEIIFQDGLNVKSQILTLNNDNEMNLSAAAFFSSALHHT